MLENQRGKIELPSLLMAIFIFMSCYLYWVEYFINGSNEAPLNRSNGAPLSGRVSEVVNALLIGQFDLSFYPCSSIALFISIIGYARSFRKLGRRTNSQFFTKLVLRKRSFDPAKSDKGGSVSLFRIQLRHQEHNLK